MGYKISSESLGKALNVEVEQKVETKIKEDLYKNDKGFN
jgi:hypothetical protein